MAKGRAASTEIVAFRRFVHQLLFIVEFVSIHEQAIKLAIKDDRCSCALWETLPSLMLGV